MTSAPNSASIMPAQGPVINVPCSMTRMPFNTPPICNMFCGLFTGRLEIRRDFPVVVDGSRASVRKNESNGAHLLLQKVRDEPCGSRKSGHSLQRAQRIAGIEKYCGYRARYVQLERLANEIRQQALNLPCDIDMRSRRSDFSRDGKQARGARILILMLWMPITRDGLPTG